MKHTQPTMFDTKHADNRLMRVLQTMLLGMLICLTMPANALDCTQNRWDVTTHTELVEAIDCFNGKTGASVSATIKVQNDIAYAGSVPIINNPVSNARLIVDGIQGRTPKIKLTGTRGAATDVRAFEVQGDNQLFVSDLDITNFDTSGLVEGGALLGRLGKITMSRVIVRQAVASTHASGITSFAELVLKESTFEYNLGAANGAVHVSGADARLFIDRSTFADNRSTEAGGGIYLNSPSVNNLIRRATFSRNRAESGSNDAKGGAIAAMGANTQLKLISNTIAGNVANMGGGVYVGHAINATNNVIALNTTPPLGMLPGSADDCQKDSSANVTDEGHNLVQAVGNCAFNGSGSITGVDPELNSLADNGGETRTMEPKLGSPVIDAGNYVAEPFAFVTTDQRQSARLLDGTFNGTVQIDIGAFEYDPQCRPGNTTWAVSNQGMYRAAIHCFNRKTDNSTYTIQIPVSIPSGFFEIDEATLAVNDTTPDSQATLVIDGQQKAIRGGSSGGSSNTHHLLYVASGNVVLQNIEMSGVSRAQINGGAVYNADRLTVIKSYFHDNEITRWTTGGAAVFSDEGSLTIRQSTFANNQANITNTQGIGQGGAVYVRRGDVVVENSTFSVNQAGARGGAIAILSLDDETAILDSNTFVDNNLAVTSVDPQGAAIYLRSGENTQISNTVISGAANVALCHVEFSAASLTGSHNHIFDGSCGASRTGDPQLNALQANFGIFTPIHTFDGTSPLLDAGYGGLGRDQINTLRPQGAVTDIGAYEFPQSPQFVLKVTVVGEGKVDGSGDAPQSGQVTACRRDGGGSCSVGYLDTLPQESVTLTATVDSGHRFVGWSGDCFANGSVPEESLLSMDADKNCTATFEPITYNVSVMSSSGGTVTQPPTSPVNQGASSTFEVTAAEGYVLDGFALSVPDCASPQVVNGSQWTTGAVTADCTITINFLIKQYTLDYRIGTTGAIQGSSMQIVNHNADGTPVEVVPNSGYRFVGWSDNRTDNPRTDTGVTNNLITTAIIERITHNVTVTAGSGGSVTQPATNPINQGSNSIFTITPNAGFEVDQVSHSPAGCAMPQIIGGNDWGTGTVNADCTIAVSFKTIGSAGGALFSDGFE